MGELESAKQEHLGQIPQAQFVQQSAEHDLEYDGSRKLKVIERSAGSVIRLPSAIAAAKYGVAEISSAVQVPEFRRVAMRAHPEAAAQNTELAEAAPEPES